MVVRWRMTDGSLCPRIPSHRLTSDAARHALGFVLDPNPRIWRFWAHNQPELAADWFAAGIADCTVGTVDVHRAARLGTAARWMVEDLAERGTADERGWLGVVDALLQASLLWAGEREGEALSALALKALSHVPEAAWQPQAARWMTWSWDPAWRRAVRAQGAGNEARAPDDGLTLGHRLVARCAHESRVQALRPAWRLLLSQWMEDGGAWGHTDAHGWTVAQRARRTLPAVALFEPALAGLWLDPGQDPEGARGGQHWVEAVLQRAQTPLQDGNLLEGMMRTLTQVLTVPEAAATDATGRAPLGTLLRRMADAHDTFQPHQQACFSDTMKRVLQHPRFQLEAWQDAGARMDALSGRETRVLRQTLRDGERRFDEAVARELDADLPAAATAGRPRL